MGLREYFQQRGRLAQHNAQVLAAQRGLQPWDRVQSMEQIEESRIPPIPPPRGPHRTTDIELPSSPTGYNRSLMTWRGEDEVSDPNSPWAKEWERVKAGLLGQNELAKEPDTAPQDESAVYDQIFVDEPAGPAQTSYSPVFGQSATFVPGTRIYGRGDPAKVREFNAMQAQQDDYDRRRAALDAAVAIPEGWEREMRAENPAALMEARTKMANARSVGEQALGSRPSRALPTDTTRLGEIARAQGQAEAQPYINTRELQKFLGEADISSRPEFAADLARREAAKAAAELQPGPWSLGEALHQRALELAEARNAGMFGGVQTTPAQAEAVAGAQQTTPAEGEPAAGPPMNQGQGRVLTMEQIARVALRTGVPVETVKARARAQGYVVPQ